jgi:hypothetical protein
LKALNQSSHVGPSSSLQQQQLSLHLQASHELQEEQVLQVGHDLQAEHELQVGQEVLAEHELQEGHELLAEHELQDGPELQVGHELLVVVVLPIGIGPNVDMKHLGSAANADPLNDTRNKRASKIPTVFLNICFPIYVHSPNF